MKTRENRYLFFLMSLIVMTFLSACRDDEFVTYMQESVIDGATQIGDAKGMYLVCEGNMGSNKATVDYLDMSASDGKVHYQRNIFAQRNPSTVLELGDVANDIQVYGSKLWVVVNASNKVEVCTADSCKRLGQVNIPNCRYVVFNGGYAYVSSYVGPIQIDSNSPIGKVYKVDTLTMQTVGTVEVGYQPEEMAVVGGKLYVANSGGYRAPNYDTTVSVIDLTTFTEERKIDVAMNLHRLRKDKYNQLWVTSRGDYASNSSALYYLSRNGDGTMAVAGKLDVPISEMCIVGDSLYYIGTQYSDVTHGYTRAMGIVNVKTHKEVQTTLFDADEIKSMTLPYGIIVNPKTKDFYLMDAKDYVSSGELLHFDADGKFLWRQWTGDIPSRACFVGTSVAIDEYEPHYDGQSAYIQAVDEYVPAPGQFVNTLPKYEEGDDAAAMARKCTEAIANNAGGMVSLGGYGGYISFHFDHTVKNIDGEYDLLITGNAMTTSSEPGILMVSQDTNNNGLPDDEWYELSGSADVDSIGKVTYGYSITYTYSPMQNVPWTDSEGNSGTIDRNEFHAQEYFPLWLTSSSTLKFSGTLLPKNGYDKSGKGTYWMTNAFRYGYVDNLPNSNSEGCSFKIDWAVEPVTRKAVHLDGIDFIRVYSGMNQKMGWLGETSTEVCGAKDLHM